LDEPWGLRLAAFRLYMSRALVFVAGVVLLLSSVTRAQQAPSNLDPAALSAAIERALTVAPPGFEALLVPSQAGVRVLDVDVERLSPSSQRITVDLSQKTLTYDPSGNVEAILDQVLRSTGALTMGAGDVQYRLLVDGLPLDQFLPRLPVGVARARALGQGGRVVVSAGHGWYWYEPARAWRLQRDYYWGIVEDFVNWDIASYVRDELAAAAFDVRPARYPSRDVSMGVAGQPAWQDSAKYFIKSLGAPVQVSDYGVDEYSRDINSRPFYANWIDSAVMISIHNNGGGGTGTETWYDETNGYAGESRRLAQIVNDKVVAAIRANYNPQWPDRGLRSCNGCKGETRLAMRPAILLEVAFMDMKTPDNEALHSETFKQIVARAVREALQEFAGP
jgi:N-acetylmuramoyl-L-alanine amidase